MDNLAIKDAGGAQRQVATKEAGGVHHPIGLVGFWNLGAPTLVSPAAGLPVWPAMRRDTDDGTADDGGASPLYVNEYGRLKVSTMPGLYALITGSIAAAAQTVAVDVSRSSNVQIHMVATALVGHNSIFEGSIDSTDGQDGNWFGIQVVRSNANTIETTTGVLAATPTYAWEASVNGLSWMRVRATAHTSGTAMWKFQRGSYATEPIPAAQTTSTQQISGPANHSAAATLAPVRIGGKVVTTVDTTLVNADACDLAMTQAGQAIIKPFGDAGLDLSYDFTAVTASTINVVLFAAGGASIRNYITALQAKNVHASQACELLIVDGGTVGATDGTVIARIHLSALMLNNDAVVFPNPKRGTANTATHFRLSAAGSVYLSVQGYKAF